MLRAAQRKGDEADETEEACGCKQRLIASDGVTLTVKKAHKGKPSYASQPQRFDRIQLSQPGPLNQQQCDDGYIEGRYHVEARQWDRVLHKTNISQTPKSRRGTTVELNSDFKNSSR